MTVTNEVLNTTYEDKRGPLVDVFLRENILLKHLVESKRDTMESGTFVDRPIAGGAPTQLVGVYSGDEQLPLTRLQQISLYRIEPHRVAGAIFIPNRELRQNDGKKGAVHLIQSYPQTTMFGFQQDMNSYLYSGVSTGIAAPTAELSGFSCLNGGFTGGRLTGTGTGILAFEPPATQSATVQNVALSQAIGHYNQHQSMTDWASGGLLTIRRAIRQANSYGAGYKFDLGILDPDLHANFDDTLLGNHVRTRYVEDAVDKGDQLDGVPFMGGMIYTDEGLDRTQFATTAVGDSNAPASQGVGYYLSTGWWEIVYLEPASLTPFEDKIADQDGVVSKFAVHMGIICKKLTAQATTSGGAV